MRVIFKSALPFVALLISGGAALAATPKASLHELPMVFQNDANKPARLADWKGKNVVITMAYTSCSSTCPMTLKKLQDMQAKLDELGQKADFVVVTLDSKKDTPEKLAAYRKKAGLDRDNWNFLYAPEKDLRKLSMALGIKYRRNVDSGEIMHDNKIVLLSPDGSVKRVLDGLNAPILPLFEAEKK